MEFECASSEHSSCDDRSYDELLKVVTRTGDSLQLDWPQEQEIPRRSKLDDSFLSGGQGEAPERRQAVGIKPMALFLHDSVLPGLINVGSHAILPPASLVFMQ
ncbi:unnamed protein product [Leuciscus chuanchicus]